MANIIAHDNAIYVDSTDKTLDSTLKDITNALKPVVIIDVTEAAETNGYDPEFDKDVEKIMYKILEDECPPSSKVHFIFDTGNGFIPFGIKKELVDGVIMLNDGSKDYTISVDAEGVWNIVSENSAE